MDANKPKQDILDRARSRTVIITGAGGGIGAATAREFNNRGATVVLADIPALESNARELIASFSYPDHAVFIPVDIRDWQQMQRLFQQTIQMFGSVDTVVANAGVMESEHVLDMEDVDSEGNLRESQEASRVIDINIKGTLNSTDPTLDMGTATDSVYCWTTSIAAGHAPHAIIIQHEDGATVHCYGGIYIGVLWGDWAAKRYNISITAVAPFFTPTAITSGLTERWKAAGLEANTPEMVGKVIFGSALDDNNSGSCLLVAGKFLRELELTRSNLIPEWLGGDVKEFMDRAFNVIQETGGYQLPKIRAKV
ncbi:short chain dehydrogenase/reductase [Aspergillus bombycis]|uniref:Short chain dehydrogenase/reductase n=1 Tax=Aspergillus bombycis TaxID=109264 RepID=A0A1F8AGP0_9EURO|nr:short chain dehydrogenase/reductase [Aspergillus bombycis]OGM50903.1 short chain dehydrogenase/reductase [Aspergillus bombycis]